MPQANLSKTERINLRLDTTAKGRLERAAALEGQTLSRYVLTTALARAEQVIAANETLVLSRHDAEVFFEAIVNPPALTPALAAALEEHTRRVQSQ
ncbi:hypothetical protein CCR95_16035 [Thiocystis minor]|uniref:type II toxin-antitoxin system TacA family antitoxin n=1 Tax=Thiocystis minor TaxID=61597 RepID=UPI0019119884|nr:DUF1778 domain-containing protein [Thiocystis minor]MBK5965555.1 hypothetical protein [Thiocystis minor]